MRRLPGGIDWDEVRRQLASGQQALERALAGDDAPAEARRRQRALDLARAPEVPAPQVAILVAHGRAGTYGLALADIARVVPVARVAPVPEAPMAVVGALAVAGEVHMLIDIDLAGGAGRIAADAAMSGHAVVLRRPSLRVALRVERADHIRLVPAAHLAGSVARPDTPGVRAVTDDRTLILDIDAMLRHPLLRTGSP